MEEPVTEPETHTGCSLARSINGVLLRVVKVEVQEASVQSGNLSGMPGELIVLKSNGFQGSVLTMMSRSVLDTLHSFYLILITTLRSWHCHFYFTDKEMKVQRG